MTAPDPASAVERLTHHAKLWNEHPSLRAFGAALSFPNGTAVRIEVNQISAPLRGGLGDDAVVNGGALSALCDLIIGSTPALVDMSTRSATVQLSIRFERPLRGERIVGDARVDHHTGRTVFASAEIHDEHGAVCVRCQGIVTLLGKRPG